MSGSNSKYHYGGNVIRHQIGFASERYEVPQPIDPHDKQILLRKKGREDFVDATDRIDSIYKENGMWTIRFKLSPEVYHYHPDSVRIIGEAVRTTGGEYGPFVFDQQKPRNEKLMEYLLQFCKCQAEHSDVKDDNEEGLPPFGLIEKHLEKVNGTAYILGKYLSGQALIKKSNNIPIAPFGCNASQKAAAEAALRSEMSVIEGPPGTGKTQTILNIIANLLIEGKTVAVVSNNNSAVSNVQEKLEKLQLGWLVAPLGRRELRDHFFESGQRDIYVDQAWRVDDPDKLYEIIKIQYNEIDEIFRKQRRLQVAIQELANAEHELQILKKQYESDLLEIEQIYTEFLSVKCLPDQMRTIKTKLMNKLEPLKWYQLIRRWLFFEAGIKDPNRLIDCQEKAIYALNIAILRGTISLLQKETLELKDWLSGRNKDIVDKYVSNSLRYFKHKLWERYDKAQNQQFNISSYQLRIDEFQKRYPIITSSTYSLKPSVGFGIFDYIIFDEASQVNIPSAALCFSMAKRVVIVGDSNQLTHIVNADTVRITNSLYSDYDALENSILSSVKKVFANSIPVTMLREHYRCHPLIVDFCNKRFYDNEMIVMSKDDGEFPFLIILVDDNKIDSDPHGSYLNVRQASETVELIEQFKRKGVAAEEIGVIAPYRYHASTIGQMLPHEQLVESDTVHKYQGREKDVIIYNTVLGQVTTFNDNPNLVNVAVSRAKSNFVLVGPASIMNKPDSNLASLMGYIRYHDPDCNFISHSKRASIFDVLYAKDGQFGSFLKQSKSGESPAETIFRNLLEQVLGSSKGLSWNYKQEYYLLDLIKTSRKTGQFTEEEWQYMLHGSRLDFLIYDELTQDPIAAIEVDGSSHLLDSGIRRDQLKNHIMNELNIPLLRFSTRSSEGKEEQQLRDTLNNIFIARNKV